MGSVESVIGGVGLHGSSPGGLLSSASSSSSPAESDVSGKSLLFLSVMGKTCSIESNAARRRVFPAHNEISSNTCSSIYQNEFIIKLQIVFGTYRCKEIGRFGFNRISQPTKGSTRDDHLRNISLDMISVRVTNNLADSANSIDWAKHGRIATSNCKINNQ